MKSLHAEVLGRVYSHFTQGQFAAMLDLCSEKVTFQLAGKSPLAGKYTRDTFQDHYGSKLNLFTGGTYQFEVHDILTSDLHATVLASVKMVRNGKSHEFRTVHVWRFENGKPLAGYEYTRDLYAFDEALIS